MKILKSKCWNLSGDAWYEFVGLMYGDGSRGSRGSGWLLVFSEDAEEIERKVLCLLGLRVRRYKHSGSEKCFMYYIPVGVMRKLDWLKEKVKLNLLDLSERQVASVLRGIFEADGTVNEEGRIQFSNVDRDLVEEVKSGLERLGVECSLNFNVRKVGREVGRLNILSKGAKVFCEKIGFITERKKQYLSKDQFDAYRVRDKKIREIFGELNDKYFHGRVNSILGYHGPRVGKAGEFTWGECGEKYMPGIDYPVRFVNLCALLLERWVPLYVVRWHQYHELIHLFRRDYRKRLKCDHNRSFWDWMERFEDVDETKVEIWMIKHSKAILDKGWWTKELRVFVAKYKMEFC